MDGRAGGKDVFFNYARRQTDPIPGQVFLYSSLESQFSVEMTMPDGTSDGVFTLAIADALRSAKHVTYNFLYKNAFDFVANRCNGSQTPEMWPDEGPVLSNPFLSPPSQLDAQAAEMQPAVSSVLSPQVPEPPFEAKEEKVIVRMDNIRGAPAPVAKKIEEALGNLDYVRLTKEDFFDRVVRGDMNKGVLRLRLVSRVGDTIPVPLAHNVNDAIKALIRQLENDYGAKQLIRIHNPHPSFRVRVWVTDEKRNDFMIGEKVEFNLVAEKDCYLLVLDKDNAGNITLLYPNRFRKDNFVRGGAIVKIPDDGMKFDLRFLEPAGEETVKVIATDKPLKLEDIGIGDIESRLVGQDFIGLTTADGGVKRFTKHIGRIQEILAKGSFTWSDALVVIRSHKKTKGDFGKGG